MYRIDEDTYVDDTLITCAEYQVFIDEMRVQGKYHQPDHWTEYHFPRGQARKPILGVRPSDAVAFCEWLTRRQMEVWRFRIPIMVEAQEHPVLTAYPSPLGYWTMDKNAPVHFAWICAVPTNPRAFDRNRSHTLNLAIDSYRARERGYGSLDKDVFDININHAISLGLVRDLDRALDRALERAIDFDRALSRPLVFVEPLVSEHDLANAFDRAINQTLNRTPDRPLDRAFDHALDRALDLVIDVYHDRALNRNQDHVFIEAIDNYLDIFVDLFTLQERIAGRSPAFEGIRIVKERIR